MKRILAILACVFLSFSLISCGAQKAESSSAAIKAADAMKNMQQKADYLISQAKAFYNSKEFDEAINIAQYVLSYVDKESTAAKDLLEKAKAELTKAAQGAMDDAKSKFGFK